MNYTTDIENYPGFKKVTGQELSEKMASQVKALKVEVIEKEVMKLTGKGGAFKVECADGSTHEGSALIIGTGAEHRTLGTKGEKDFSGKGVSYCATCDGPLFTGKAVAVIGGGNTALTAALFLAGICSKVYLVHRRNEFRAEAALVEQVKANDKIEIVFNSVPIEIKGEKFVNALSIANVESKEKKDLDVEGIFINVGVKPASELALGLGVELDDKGNVKVNLHDCSTSVPGAYAAGDVTGEFKQIVTATAQGALAATSAIDYLKKKN
jgi:thioredoxin reductase (NADPH)